MNTVVKKGESYEVEYAKGKFREVTPVEVLLYEILQSVKKIEENVGERFMKD